MKGNRDLYDRIVKQGKDAGEFVNSVVREALEKQKGCKKRGGEE
jgi:hypothetical protein